MPRATTTQSEACEIWMPPSMRKIDFEAKDTFAFLLLTWSMLAGNLGPRAAVGDAISLNSSGSVNDWSAVIVLDASTTRLRGASMKSSFHPLFFQSSDAAAVRILSMIFSNSERGAAFGGASA